MLSAPFQIGKCEVGGEAPVLIVAELSANHGGNLERALRTIEAAASAGANAIKIQTYTPDTLTLRSTSAPFVVQTDNQWKGRTLYDLYAEAMTPWEWHPRLKQAAEDAGLIFFSTPFDFTAANFLDQLGVSAYKIASFELNDLPLIEHIARLGKPMILSTGMATLEEIGQAVATCRGAGNAQLALLRCVSTYPARPEAMNLTSLHTLRSLGTVVGLSDHTRESTVAIASVALGAQIVEKHLVLDRANGGPDAFFSIEPDEFAALVRSVRQTESAMGPPRFGPSEDERASVRFRRSLFVANAVPRGAVVTCDDVRSVRPSDGLAPQFLPRVLGRVAARDLAANSPLTWADVEERPDGPLLVLRPATLDDAAALRSWRNDPLTREQSLSPAPVAEDEHREWLDRSLKDPQRRLFIVSLGAEALGQVRLDDRGEQAWEVSFTLAPLQRGRRPPRRCCWRWKRSHSL